MSTRPRFQYSITILLLWIFSSGTIYGQEEFKDIVLLNSYHPTFQWTADITRGVLEEFSEIEKYRVFVEYMDSKRFQNEEYLKNLQKV